MMRIIPRLAGRKSLLRRRADVRYAHEPLKARNPLHVNIGSSVTLAAFSSYEIPAR